MKLCIAGNSHIGMLRAALPDALQPDVTFFATAEGKFGQTELHGSELVETSLKRRAVLADYGLPERVDLGSFDAVIFAGAVGGMVAALHLTAATYVSDWPLGQTAMIEARAPAKATAQAPARAPLHHPLLSGRAVEAALEVMLRQRQAHRLASALRAASDVAILIVPEPLLGAHVTEKKTPAGLRARQVKKHREGRALMASVRAARARAYGQIGGLQIIEQPEHTIEAGFLTKPAFTRGALRLDGARTHGTDDVMHGNAALGALLFQRITDTLNTHAN